VFGCVVLGVWGCVCGGWPQTPNPQTPNPQSPIPNNILKLFFYLYLLKQIKNLIKKIDKNNVRLNRSKRTLKIKNLKNN